MDTAIPVSKNKALHSYAYTTIFFSIATALTLTISYYKLLTLYYWLYPGDVFLVDQLLTETLKGNFGLEFAFGKFGCHYYFFLLFLLPFKMILAEKTVCMLIILPILFYFTTSCILFFLIRSLTKNTQVSFLCGLIFLFTPNIMGGLYSYYNGTACVDDLSGYIAVLFVCFLNTYNETKNKNFYTFFIFTYFLFITLGELFVLFATIYFFINTIYYKNKKYCILFIVPLIIFSLQVLYRDRFFLPTNWSMTAIGINGLKFFLNPHQHLQYLCATPPATLLRYFSVILSLSCIFMFLIAQSKKINMLIIGLFIIGLMKCCIGYLLKDLNLRSWHNFPGIIMMTGALALQISEHARIKKVNNTFYLSIAGLFLLFFLLIDIPYVINRAQMFSEQEQYVTQRREYFAEIIKMIDPSKLSIIPDNTRFASVLNHYTRFILTKKSKLRLDAPPGIVDYIVLPVEGSECLLTMDHKLEAPSLNTIRLGNISDDFTLIDRNKYYLLYKRAKISKADLEDRRYIFDLFGLSDI